MSAMELQSQLRALRVPPQQSDFEARLHNALLREANLMQVSARAQRRPLRWLPELRQWRLAVLVLALSASATAMLVATAVRRQPAPEPMNTTTPVAPALPRTTKSPSPVHRVVETPIAPPAPPPAIAPPLAPTPLSVPHVVPPTSPEERNSLAKPPMDEAAQRPLEVRPEETPKLQLDRLGLPENLPAPALEHRANPPQLRGRPALDLPERQGSERSERKDSAAKRREKRSERPRSDNAERGLERAREVQQQHVRQR